MTFTITGHYQRNIMDIMLRSLILLYTAKPLAYQGVFIMVGKFSMI